MLLTCIVAVLCAYGAVMAAWALMGRWLGIPLTVGMADWIREIYRKETEAMDGRNAGRCHTSGRLRE